MKISIIKRIRIDFLIIFVCVLSLAIWNYFEVKDIYKITHNIYNHPLIVSNLTRDMKSEINYINNKLKESFYLNDNPEDQLTIIQDKINEIHKSIQGGFITLHGRYLGEKFTVDDAYNAFQLWEQNINKFYELYFNNRKTEAIKILKNDIPDSYHLFNVRIQQMTNFADYKADEFINKANQKINNKIARLVGFSMILLIILGFIYYGQVSKILVPIKRMKEMIYKFQKGDYSGRTMIKTDDEIGEFSTAFDDLLNQLVEYNESLEDMVQSRTETLEKEIADSKAKSQELRLLASRMELASQIAGVGVWERDLVKETLRWDKRMLSIFEVDEKEFNGRFGYWLNLISENDKDRVEEEFENAIKMGSRLISHFKIQLQDGRIKYIEIQGEIQVDEFDLPVSIFGVARDVSDIVAAKEALDRYNEDLEEKVKSRTEVLANSQKAMGYLLEDTNTIMKELKQSNIEKERVNKELEAFSYSVSHDLRAPLRGIDGFSMAILEDYKEVLDEQAVHYLKRIRKAAQKMSNLIDNILKLSRISRKELTVKELNVSEISKEIINDLVIANPERNAEFVIEPGIKVKGDKELCSVLLSNLIRNAWKYSSQKDKTVIEIFSKKEDDKILVAVQDNGAGFNMKFKDKLFVPFQRLHSSTFFEGSGIGLATCMRIVNKHQGTIWGESEMGKGAVFYFSLIND